MTAVPGKIGKAHYTKSQCLMKIAGDALHEVDSLSWPIAVRRSRRVTASCSHGCRPNRDAAQRYSDCALSGFADFFRRDKRGISVTTGQATTASETTTSGSL